MNEEIEQTRRKAERRMIDTAELAKEILLKWIDTEVSENDGIRMITKCYKLADYFMEMKAIGLEDVNG